MYIFKQLKTFCINLVIDCYRQAKFYINNFFLGIYFRFRSIFITENESVNFLFCILGIAASKPNRAASGDDVNNNIIFFWSPFPFFGSLAVSYINFVISRPILLAFHLISFLIITLSFIRLALHFRNYTKWKKFKSDINFWRCAFYKKQSPSELDQSIDFIKSIDWEPEKYPDIVKDVSKGLSYFMSFISAHDINCYLLYSWNPFANTAYGTWEELNVSDKYIFFLPIFYIIQECVIVTTFLYKFFKIIIIKCSRFLLKYFK